MCVCFDIIYGNSACVCCVVNLADKFLETSVDDEMDSPRPKETSRSTGDSPVRQVQKKNLPLNLPDWQPLSTTKPVEDSPVVEVAPSELFRPPVATEYSDQQPVTESPVHVDRKSDVSSQPINWEQLDKPVPAVPPVSFDEKIDSQQSKETPRSSGDSPICQVRKNNLPLNLPDWQPSSAAKPEEDSPVVEVAPSELSWPPVVTEYSDQQPVTESPVHADLKSDVSSQPIDWEQLDKPPVSFPTVTKQILEGDVYEAEEKSETDELAEDGSDCHIRRRVTSRRQMLPVSELTLENGVEVSRTTSDVTVAVHVDEFVDILPLGIDDPHADGLEMETSVEELSEPLETGGSLTRRVTTTTVRRLQAPEISRMPEECQPHDAADVEGLHDGKNQVKSEHGNFSH